MCSDPSHPQHRGRILYSPWVVARILAAHPQIHLCADLSHFSCVAESGPLEPEINKVLPPCYPVSGDHLSPHGALAPDTTGRKPNPWHSTPIP